MNPSKRSQTRSFSEIIEQDFDNRLFPKVIADDVMEAAKAGNALRRLLFEMNKETKLETPIIEKEFNPSRRDSL